MVQSFPTSAAGIQAELLYSVGEVAKHYKVHAVTIHRWIKLGRLHRIRVGPNTTRISGASIIANQRAIPNRGAKSASGPVRSAFATSAAMSKGGR